MMLKTRILAVMGLVVLEMFSGCRVGNSNSSPSQWTLSLQDALSGMTRMRVRSGGTCHRNPQHERTLLEVTDAATIASLVRHIELRDDKSGFACMCCGEPTMEFYRGENLAVSLGYHHGQSLRWDGGRWKGDGLLTPESAKFVNGWLADRGVDGPQNEQEEERDRREKSLRSQERWLQAMPSSLKPFWPGMGNPFGRSDADAMHEALVTQYGNRDERILALLTWFGSGAGPWSGFPSYEQHAEKLLLRYDTEQILGAIKGKDLDSRSLEGIARLFGGWEFSGRRPADRRLLPASLKRRMLEHCLASDDQDKRSRAKKAFQ